MTPKQKSIMDVMCGSSGITQNVKSELRAVLNEIWRLHKRQNNTSEWYQTYSKLINSTINEKRLIIYRKHRQWCFKIYNLREQKLKKILGVEE